MSKSTYYLVKAQDGSEVVVFSHTTSQVLTASGELVAEPTGGQAVIHGKIIKEL